MCQLSPVVACKRIRFFSTSAIFSVGRVLTSFLELQCQGLWSATAEAQGSHDRLQHHGLAVFTFEKHFAEQCSHTPDYSVFYNGVVACTEAAGPTAGVLRAQSQACLPCIVARKDELFAGLIHKHAMLDADEGPDIMLGWHMPGTAASCSRQGTP